MSAPSPGWYLRRLRAMSPAEVGYRALDGAQRAVWARRQVLPGALASVPADLRADRSVPLALPLGAHQRLDPADLAGLLAAADSVLDGSWTVFGTRRSDSADPDWFADPVTGRRAPQSVLCFRVHHRDESEIGNVKQIWEMSRHHHLTVLAAAYWASGEERYAEAAADQLRSWWRANPFLSGVHWTSGIEVGIRLLAWVWVRRLLDDWPKIGDLFENDDDALRQIAWHQEFLAAFPSRGSSANNHLIAEAAGALAGACAFGWYARSPRWRDRAARALTKSFAANTFAGGLNREQASDYHGFVTDLVLLAALEADAAGHPLDRGTWQRIASTLDAGASVTDMAGRPPRQGDGDEGRALVVDGRSHGSADGSGSTAWQLTLDGGRAVLGAPSWWPAPVGGVQPVLLGALHAASASGERRPSRATEPIRAFADAGLVLLRSAAEDGAEIWCRCDSGPHGFGTIAGHAHADALSVEVRHGGVDVLADPGTYCYHGEPEWREHFRSTAAHNTVQLGGVDSSRSGGPFLWTRHARSRTLGSVTGARFGQSVQAVQWWEGEHDGYRRLPTPMVHRRRVTLDSPLRLLTVADTIVDTIIEPVAGERVSGTDVRLTWQLGPEVEAELDGALALLSWPGGSGRLSLPEALTWSAHRGQRDPIRGWYSPGFGERVPATVLIGQGRADKGRGQTVLVTELRFEDQPFEQGETQ